MDVYQAVEYAVQIARDLFVVLAIVELFRAIFSGSANVASGVRGAAHDFSSSNPYKGSEDKGTEKVVKETKDNKDKQEEAAKAQAAAQEAENKVRALQEPLVNEANAFWAALKNEANMHDELLKVQQRITALKAKLEDKKTKPEEAAVLKEELANLELRQEQLLKHIDESVKAQEALKKKMEEDAQKNAAVTTQAQNLDIKSEGLNENLLKANRAEIDHLVGLYRLFNEDARKLTDAVTKAKNENAIAKAEQVNHEISAFNVGIEKFKLQAGEVIAVTKILNSDKNKRAALLTEFEKIVLEIKKLGVDENNKKEYALYLSDLARLIRAKKSKTLTEKGLLNNEFIDKHDNTNFVEDEHLNFRSTQRVEELRKKIKVLEQLLREQKRIVENVKNRDAAISQEEIKLVDEDAKTKTFEQNLTAAAVKIKEDLVAARNLLTAQNASR